LLHILKKLVTERAIYEKFTKDLDEGEKIEITVPLEQFEHEARDFTT
jgi:hypothetical protein